MKLEKFDDFHLFLDFSLLVILSNLNKNYLYQLNGFTEETKMLSITHISLGAWDNRFMKKGYLLIW